MRLMVRLRKHLDCNKQVEIIIGLYDPIDLGHWPVTIPPPVARKEIERRLAVKGAALKSKYRGSCDNHGVSHFWNIPPETKAKISIKPGDCIMLPPGTEVFSLVYNESFEPTPPFPFHVLQVGDDQIVGNDGCVSMSRLTAEKLKAAEAEEGNDDSVLQ